MDSSSSSASAASSSCHDHHHHNWLAFSLSNHSNSQHQHLSLFQPPTPSSSLFNSTPSLSPTNGGDVLINGDQENRRTATDQLSSVLGGEGVPKLEDFLGGATADAGPHLPTQGGNIVDMYDESELKSIAASFLCGFSSNDTNAQKRLAEAAPPEPPAKKAAAETFGQRTSVFRGVTRHRWTGRYEAHLWDNSCRREGQSRKGRQVYLGGYDKEEKAARAYDLAAIKYWGPTTTTNFPVSDYGKEMEEMKNMTRQEFVASLRRKSSGFSRGASIYRGVTRHHQHGRWQARIGRVAGNKDLYLGTFSTQEEAAEAYDIAAIKFRGLNAVTNFDISRYDVRSIASSNLPIGGVNNNSSNNNNKSKTSSDSLSDNKSIDGVQSDDNTTKDVSSGMSSTFPIIPSQNPQPTLNFTIPQKHDHQSLWAALGYSQNPNPVMIANGTTPYSMEYQPNLSNHPISNSEGFLNYYNQQQGNSSGTTSGSGPAINENSNGTAHEAAALGFGINGGNWHSISSSSLSSFQPSKPNLSAFQTPIFGIE